MTTLYSRLIATDSDPIGEGLVRTWHRNPDGPEAAALLREMLRALLEASDRMCEVGSREPVTVNDAINAAIAAGVPET